MSKSKDELYIIGVDFKNNRDKYKKILNSKNPSWNDLNESQGFQFKTREHYRQFIKKRQDRDGTLKKLNVNKEIINNIVLGAYFPEEDNITKSIERARLKDKESVPNYKESVEIKQDNSQVSDKVIPLSDEELKDVDFILKSHNYDPKAWELISAKHSIWNVNTKVDGVKSLYSSKISVRPYIKSFDTNWIKSALEELDLDSPVIEQKPYHIKGKTLEINLADVHIDKLCCIDETRNEYSTEIGIQSLWQVINDIIEKVKHYNIKKIIFPFGQDVCNIDNIFNTTTKGTSQDTDVKYDVMYKLLLKNIIQIIHKLTDIAPVLVIYVGGNHDKITSFTMTEAMYWHFLNNDNVEVDSVFNNRKYIMIGKNLLGLAHGADERKNIVYCMQNDVPELWGKAKYREFHLSHFHKEKMVDEQNGIIFRWISSICGTDSWTYNSGYVGSQKKAQSFIWDDDKGLEMIINSYV